MRVFVGLVSGVAVGIIAGACSDATDVRADTGDRALEVAQPDDETTLTLQGALLQPGDGRTVMCLGFPESAHATCTQFAEVQLPASIAEGVKWDEDAVALPDGVVTTRSADGLAISFTYDNADVAVQAVAAGDASASPMDLSDRNPTMPSPVESGDFEGLAPEEVNFQLHLSIKAEAQRRGVDLTGLFGVSMGANGQAVVTLLSETPEVSDLLGTTLSKYRYQVRILGRADSSAER